MNKIIYTYRTFNGAKLQCNFNDLETANEIILKSFWQSINLGFTVKIYTDLEGELHLLTLGIPQKNIVVFSFDETISSLWWNYSKIEVYAHQTEPFLHLDLDVILDETPKNLDAPIVSEEFRGLQYLSTQLTFLPESIKKAYKPWCVCAGVIGGNNLDVFKRLKEFAQPIVRRITNPTSMHRDMLEEVILTSICNANNIEIKTIDSKYTHYQGKEKPQTTTSIWI